METLTKDYQKALYDVCDMLYSYYSVRVTPIALNKLLSDDDELQRELVEDTYRDTQIREQLVNLVAKNATGLDFPSFGTPEAEVELFAKQAIFSGIFETETEFAHALTQLPDTTEIQRCVCIKDIVTTSVSPYIRGIRQAYYTLALYHAQKYGVSCLENIRSIFDECQLDFAEAALDLQHSTLIKTDTQYDDNNC